MLVATPAQTAARYPLHSSTITSTTTTGTAVTTSKLLGNNNNSNNSSSSHKHNLTGASQRVSLMKTLSVRLNRGTEFLKGTVQKALVSTTTSINNATSYNSNQNNTLNYHQQHKLHVISPTDAPRFRRSSIDLPKTTINSTDTVTTCAATSSSSSMAAVTATATAMATSTLTRTITTTTTATISKLHTLYTVPPTATHRFPRVRNHAESVDSLHLEMCHFKPIRTAPTTPWKCSSRSRGASLRIPKVCRATNSALILNCDVERNVANDEDDDGDNDTDIDDTSSNNVMVKQFKQFTALTHYRPKASANAIILSPITHQSAFVRLEVAAQIKKTDTISAVANMDMVKAKTENKKPLTTKANLHKTRNRRGRTKSNRAAIQKVKTASAERSTSGSSKDLTLRNRRNRLAAAKKIDVVDANINVKRNLRNMRSRNTMNSAIKSTVAEETLLLTTAKKPLAKKSFTTTVASAIRSNQETTPTKGSRLSHAMELIRQSNNNNVSAKSTGRAVRKRKVVGDVAGNAQQHASNGGNSSLSRPSPPLTRSRFKQRPQGKLFAPLDYQHRVI